MATEQTTAHDPTRSPRPSSPQSSTRAEAHMRSADSAESYRGRGRLEGRKALSPSLLAYAATKAAIVNFSKNLGQLLIERGIRVNAVAPGPVWTPLIAATMPVEQVKSFGQQAPIGRAAQPVELAPTYVFLASQESSYIAAETTDHGTFRTISEVIVRLRAAIGHGQPGAPVVQPGERSDRPMVR